MHNFILHKQKQKTRYYSFNLISNHTMVIENKGMFNQYAYFFNKKSKIRFQVWNNSQNTYVDMQDIYLPINEIESYKQKLIANMIMHEFKIKTFDAIGFFYAR